MVQSKKLWDGALSKPHYVYFSTWETKLPHARHKTEEADKIEPHRLDRTQSGGAAA